MIGFGRISNLGGGPNFNKASVMFCFNDKSHFGGKPRDNYEVATQSYRETDVCHKTCG
jgi:hypothetical protein